MLAFVNCSHFPVRIPDVPIWGDFSLKNLVNCIAVSQRVSYGPPVSKNSRVLVKGANLPAFTADLLNHMLGGMEPWIIRTYTQIWGCAWYTWHSLPGQMDLSSESYSTAWTSYTAAWTAKWVTTLKSSLTISNNTKVTLTVQPSNSSPRCIHRRETKTYPHKDLGTNVHSSFMHKNPRLETIQSPLQMT